MGAESDAVHVPLGLAVGLASGWVLAPSRMTDHALASFPGQVQLTGLVVLTVTGLLLGVWVRWVARVWAPRVHGLWSALAPLLLIAAVVTLSARTFYGIQSDIIIAHAMKYPVVSDPLAHVLISAQIVLDTRLTSGVQLLIAIVLLMLVPMAVRFATLGERRPPMPRRNGRIALALGCGAAAAMITAMVSGTVNGYIFQSPGATTLSGFIAAGAAFGAALAAGVAGLSGTSPVAKGMVAGLAAAVLYALVLELVVLPLRAALPWMIHMIILEHAGAGPLPYVLTRTVSFALSLATYEMYGVGAPPDSPSALAAGSRPPSSGPAQQAARPASARSCSAYLRTLVCRPALLGRSRIVSQGSPGR
ncbi:hypothetical protein ABGB18_41975 [Nonomuraea sp. B12E4]